MRFVRWIKIIMCVTGVVCVTSVTGCVSPFYGTARIEPGWQTSYGVALYSSVYFLGLREDVHVSYGFNPYLKAYLEAALGTAFPDLADGRIGVQAALPAGWVTPAMRLELSVYNTISLSPSFLLGIGRKEFLTLAIRTHIYPQIFNKEDPQSEFPIILTCGIHPMPQLTIFAGADIGTLGRAYYGFDPLFSLGVGYNFLKSESSGDTLNALLPLLIAAEGWINDGLTPIKLDSKIEPGVNIRPGIIVIGVLPVKHELEFEQLGFQVDVDFSYGFNEHFEIFTHTNIGSEMPILYLSPGVRFSMPLGPITPAISVDITSIPRTFVLAPSFLLGIGRNEPVTLATRFRWDLAGEYYPEKALDVFAAVHVIPQLTLFAGVETITLFKSFRNTDRYPLAKAGIVIYLPFKKSI